MDLSKIKKMVKKLKLKIPSKMKTHEILNELYDWEDEKRGDELDEELMSRYPFNYLFDKHKELEKRIKDLETQINKLKSHHHNAGKVLFES